MVGQAKLKQYSREVFLREHQLCCYCGAPADTTDHCPPRALFVNRTWPEGYEFPACDACNQQAKADEQVFSVLAPVWAVKDLTGTAEAHWQKQAKGLKNNQPEVMAELLGRTRNEQKRVLRRIYGSAGDEMRRQGYGAVDLGPLTRASILRFATKLGKALYYKHAGMILNGELWILHFSAATQKEAVPVLEQMLTIAPLASVTMRAGIDLAGQFTYRYNTSVGKDAIFFSVVQFSDQFIFNIIAVSKEFRAANSGDLQVLDREPLAKFRIDARLG